MLHLDGKVQLGLARDAFRENGRGFVLLLDDQEPLRYAFPSELVENLQSEPDARRLIETVHGAVEKYVPETEAVLVDFRGEAILVSIIRDAGSEMIGEILFEPTN